MVQTKKMIAWFLISSILIWNFSFSFANDEGEKISPEEIKKVEAEIIQLQSQLLNTWKSSFERFSKDFEKLVNYEESWTSKIEFNVDEDMFWKANASLNFNNLSIKNAILDSEISSDIAMKAKYTPVYWSWFEIDLKTFASLINKNWEIYALLKDLDFKVNDANISKVLDEAKKQFADNKYIKFPTDANSQVALNLIKSFNVKSILSESEKILSQTLLTAYKKSWDKYILIPTKYACDSYFELDKKLNFSNAWYTPKTCTEIVYKSFLKEFTKDWELYFMFGKTENTFWIYSDDNDTIVDLSLKYDQKNITKIDFIMIPDQIKYKDEWFNLHYQNGQFLKANLYAEKWLYKMDFYSELDENNHFVEIDGSINLNKDLIGNINLKNKKMSSFFLLKEKGYDKNSYKLKNVFALKTNGLFDSNNQLQSITSKFAWIRMTDKKAFLIWKFGYNGENFNIYAKYDDIMWKIVFNWKWKIENKYFQFDTDFDFNNMYTGKMNLEIDVRDNKNNANILFLLNNWGKEILKITMLNEAKREYKNNIIIEAPKDFRELNPEAITDIDSNYIDQIEELK